MVPNEPASGVVSADEVIGSELLGGFGTLSHIREIAADQFMGPMPAEVERLKTLNSCLPDLKFPWDAVEVADWSVDPPQEIKAFKPGAAFFEKEYEYYLISRGFFYDKKLENYVMYFIDADTLQECLDKYDDVQRLLDVVDAADQHGRDRLQLVCRRSQGRGVLGCECLQVAGDSVEAGEHSAHLGRVVGQQRGHRRRHHAAQHLDLKGHPLASP